MGAVPGEREAVTDEKKTEAQKLYEAILIDVDEWWRSQSKKTGGRAAGHVLGRELMTIAKERADQSGRSIEDEYSDLLAEVRKMVEEDVKAQRQHLMERK